jgi:hypothetical protein
MATKKIQKIIHAALFTPTSKGWGLPLLFWSGPGCGKTAIIEQIAAKVNFPFEVLSPGERGEGAFGVTPVPMTNPDGSTTMNYPPPEWVRKFEDSAGLVVLDELSTAAPAIQPAILGIALAKRIGGYYFGDRVRVIAAANRTEEAAGGWDLAPPLANRFGHLDWEHPEADEWGDWLLGEVDNGHGTTTDPATEEARVMAGWVKPWAMSRGLVAGFIKARPSLLHKQPKLGHPDASRSWPSHRTWEMATRALASSAVHNLSEAESDEFASAFVGAGALSELVSYRKEVDLPDPELLLDGKVAFKHDPKRLDRTYAIIGSCSSILASQAGQEQEQKTDQFKTRATTMFEVLLKVADDAIDLVWPAAKMLSGAKLHAFNKDSKELFKRLFPVATEMQKVKAA